MYKKINGSCKKIFHSGKEKEVLFSSLKIRTMKDKIQERKKETTQALWLQIAYSDPIL